MTEAAPLMKIKTVQDVMEARMHTAITVFLKQENHHDQEKIRGFSVYLAEVAFSAAGIPERDREEEW